MADEHPAQPARKSVLSSKVLWLGLAVGAAGGAMWVYGQATAPTPASGAGDLARSLTGGGETAGSQRWVDAAAPHLMRLGGSFVVGYVLACLLKGVAKLLVTVALLAGIAVWGLKHTGVIGSVNTDAVEEHVKQGVEWVKSNTDSAKAFVKTYVPSLGAMVVGMFFGARK